MCIRDRSYAAEIRLYERLFKVPAPGARREGLASAFVSITTLDRGLARAMEPRASTPAKRLEAISRLADAGCPVGVGFAPVIPGLNDHEMEAILEAAQKAGATSAMYVTCLLYPASCV